MRVDLRRKGKEKVENLASMSQSVFLQKRLKMRKTSLKRKRRNGKSMSCGQTLEFGYINTNNMPNLKNTGCQHVTKLDT